MKIGQLVKIKGRNLFRNEIGKIINIDWKNRYYIIFNNKNIPYSFSKSNLILVDK